MIEEAFQRPAAESADVFDELAQVRGSSSGACVCDYVFMCLCTLASEGQTNTQKQQTNSNEHRQTERSGVRDLLC